MTLRLWIHEGHDRKPAIVALGLDPLGFATWAESQVDVITKGGIR